MNKQYSALYIYIFIELDIQMKYDNFYNIHYFCSGLSFGHQTRNARVDFCFLKLKRM